MGKGWNNDGEKKKGSYRFIRLSNSGFIEFLSNPFQDFHTVWCLAHRINLVTRDLMDMKGINIVKAFSDWFLDNRRQTAYKKFIMQDSTRQRLRSIPQPSDTRWLFYRDVVSAILSQRNTVDVFITGHEGFSMFWDSLRQQKEKYGDLVERDFAFQDDTFRSLFQFVEFVLGFLGRVNQTFQERYLMLWEAWCILNSLKKHFFDLITSLRLSPSSFTFMTGFDSVPTEEYSTCIQRLLQSISLRFPCPSTSHDMRGMRSCLTIEFEDESIKYNPFEMNCSVSQLFKIVSFDPMSEENISLDRQDRDFVDEVQRLREEIHCHQENIDRQRIETSSSLSSLFGFEVKIKNTLTEYLQFVKRENYPR